MDEETAPVVQRIFEMCADGIPAREVANILRQEKVPTPLVSRGTNVKIEDPFKWDRLNVTRLLKNKVYIGFWSKMVQGEEISFENEALVTEDLFCLLYTSFNGEESKGVGDCKEFCGYP